MKLDMIVDLQFGSCGKGKFAYELARRAAKAGNPYSAFSAANMPNAGHTVMIDGSPVVYKALPSCSSLGDSYLSPQSVFDPARLLQESTTTTHRVFLHENIRLLSAEDKEEESQDEILRAIGSTRQGSIVPMKRRINRSHIGRVGSHAAAFSTFPDHKNITVLSTAEWFSRLMSANRLLHEVSQGTQLSVDWGTFPYTTSRNCTSAAALDSLGLSWKTVGEVVGLMRAHPIRVAGTSGPMPAERTWEEIGRLGGIPTDEIEKIKQQEFTTVTKKLRRVSLCDSREVAMSVHINGCTAIVVNFVQYLDWEAHGCDDWECLPRTVVAFVERIEKDTGVRVLAVGTGRESTAWRK